jgi:hypothetical protein
MTIPTRGLGFLDVSRPSARVHRVTYLYEKADNSTFRYQIYNMVQTLAASSSGVSAGYFFPVTAKMKWCEAGRHDRALPHALRRDCKPQHRACAIDGRPFSTMSMIVFDTDMII